jgi:hypothetical protein
MELDKIQHEKSRRNLLKMNLETGLKSLIVIMLK